MPDQFRSDPLNRRLSQMDTERSSFIGHWQELSEYIQPRASRFLLSDRNRGEKRHQKIINGAGGRSLRTSVAGLKSGLTSPTRPWFRLETLDREMMEFEPVKLWLNDVEQIMYEIFAQSNFYGQIDKVNEQLLLFATGAMCQVDDFDDVARFYSYPVGSYWIAANDRMVVDVLYRELELTTEQIVNKFGLGNVSQSVKSAYDAGNYMNVFPVHHAIEPNPDYDRRNPLSRFKRYRSIYWERGGDDKDKFLSEMGFNFFPGRAPRWDTTGEDVWGTNCPGMIALGDVKALQTMEKQKAQAIAKMVNPPVKGPASLKNMNVSMLPGGLNLFDSNDQQNGLKAVYEVTPRLGEIIQDITNAEKRIDQAFHSDLFLMLTNIDGVQPRNVYELTKREEEKLLMLGPFLERNHSELLKLIIDHTFIQANDANILPPPPPELETAPLKVRFISTLAQAMRAVGTQVIDRLAGFVAGVGQVNPDAIDKFDADQAIDEYGKLIGAPPQIIRSDDRVAEIRADRQQQQQRMQMLAAAEVASKAAKNASGPVDETSPLKKASEGVLETIGNRGR